MSVATLRPAIDRRIRLMATWISANLVAGLVTGFGIATAVTVWPGDIRIVPVVSPYAVVEVWATFSLSFGVAQWLALRRRWGLSRWWVPLSLVAGFGVPLVTLMVVGWGDAIGLGVASLPAGPAIAGLTIGAAQLLLLQPTPAHPGPWLLSSGLGCLLAVGVLWLSTTHLWVPPMPQLLVSATLAGGVYGLATSFGLWFNSR